MAKIIELRIRPKYIHDEDYLRQAISKESRIGVSELGDYSIIKRSIDGRGKHPKYVLRIQIHNNNEKKESPSKAIYNKSKTDKTIVIIGAGPSGLFAALRCLELGVKPIVLERGKDVRERRKDLRKVQQFGEVDSNSNYCFGEGGAGTYSDGKLYTRANKRGNINKILQILVDHGAKADILIDAHPHIGSNKLPNIVAAIRSTILNNGGEVHFNSKVIEFGMQNDTIERVILENNKVVEGDAFILATGHSARDIYYLCHKKNIAIEFKPFAIGVRIEHPQQLIDEIQYNQKKREENLPAASYSLACQVDDIGVFSFCMCPGGLIVPAATSPGELVVNGMSLSKRDSPFANSGTVVTLDENPTPKDVFGGMNYQSNLEKRMFDYGDGSQKAPSQRLTDFVNKKVSSSLGSSSYIPGIYSAPMHTLLPSWIYKALSRGIYEFGKKMKGYYTSEAHVIGLESRTSAPIRISRDKDTMMSPSCNGLFPCGEGAGYAGGILSAALDGDRIVDLTLEYILNK